ncbi:MAG: cyclase family protein, partial [Flavobacteriales bacterium]
LNTIGNDINSLIIRTLPNDLDKCSKLYSDTNPAYLSAEAMTFIVDLGIEHLLIDLPSVDKEHDEGRLEAHKLFWNFPKNIRTHASITELIYVPNQLEDGSYLLQIQFPKFKLDASPSRISVWALN